MPQIDASAVINRYQQEYAKLLTRCLIAETANAQAQERIAELERGEDA